MSEEVKLYAKLTLEVEVDLVSSLPSGIIRDRASEMLYIGDVKVKDVEVFGNPNAIELIHYTGAEYVDEDGLLVEAVVNALDTRPVEKVISKLD